MLNLLDTEFVKKHNQVEQKIERLKMDYLRQCISRGAFYQQYEQLGQQLRQLKNDLNHSLSYQQRMKGLKNQSN